MKVSCAGQPGQVEQRRQLLVLVVHGDEDRKAHRQADRLRVVAIEALHAAEARMLTE
jgi:hypothetical protein